MWAYIRQASSTWPYGVTVCYTLTSMWSMNCSSWIERTLLRYNNIITWETIDKSSSVSEIVSSPFNEARHYTQHCVLKDTGGTARHGSLHGWFQLLRRSIRPCGHVPPTEAATNRPIVAVKSALLLQLIDNCACRGLRPSRCVCVCVLWYLADSVNYNTHFTTSLAARYDNKKVLHAAATDRSTNPKV